MNLENLNKKILRNQKHDCGIKATMSIKGLMCQRLSTYLSEEKNPKIFKNFLKYEILELIVKQDTITYTFI